MRLRKGMVVAVEFDDHAESSDRPIRCRVYGKLVSIGRKHLVVTSWETMEDKVTAKLNDHRWSILRATIVRIVLLCDA